MDEIRDIPFVISNIPVRNGAMKQEGICKTSKIGTKILEITYNIELDWSIETITEKITINPPIIRIVDVAFVILELKASPRLESDSWFLDWLFLSLNTTELVDLAFPCFQNLNKKPTVKHAKMCVINNNMPIVELPNILIPTVPIINRGPELFVKLSNLSHSVLDKILFFLKLQAIFAPTG